MPPSKRFMELTDMMRDIHKRKNAGYAGDCDDAWANFRYSELFGIPAFKGCLVRLSDKFIRIANLTKNPNNEQVGEAITDTLLDLANYAVIAICLYEEQQGTPTVEGMQVDIEEYTKQMFEVNKKLNEKKEVNIDENIISTSETRLEDGNEHSETTVFRGWRNNVG